MRINYHQLTIFQLQPHSNQTTTKTTPLSEEGVSPRLIKYCDNYFITTDEVYTCS